MQMLEEEEVEVPGSATSEVPKDANIMETDDAQRDDVNMQESKAATYTAEGTAENGAGDSEEKSVLMETETEVLLMTMFRITTCRWS
jgi:heat shock protein 4